MQTELTDAIALPDRARAIVIQNQGSYDLAAAMKSSLAIWRKRIVEEFAPLKESAHRAHKAVTAKEAEYLRPVVEAEEIIKQSLRRWETEQEALRLAEQRRLEAVARVAAEEDRKRREAEAEAVRAAVKKQLEEEALCSAIAAGLNEVAPVELPSAAAYMEPAAYAVPVVAAATFERAKGLGIHRTWGAQIVDLKALAGAVARGEVPVDYIVGNMVALNARARADKQRMTVPGVLAVEK